MAVISPDTPAEIVWGNPDDSMNQIGKYVDSRFREGNISGSERALQILDGVDGAALTVTQRGRLHYIRANIRSDLHHHNHDGNGWFWEDENCAAWMREQRLALAFAEEAVPKPLWVNEARTNLANALSRVGRSIEAIEFWSRAIRDEAQHAMALGNRAMGFIRLGRAHYDDGHRALLWAVAHRDLAKALSPPQGLESEARQGFGVQLEWLGKQFQGRPPEAMMRNREFSLGSTKQERDYRQWCLGQGLFLNVLNDLDAGSIAAQDIFALPTITTVDFQGEEWQALYNQLKQEYTSARFMFYTGLTGTDVHFADRNVQLINTLDYPVHCFAAEQVKAAYRLTYSLFDKIAFFLNDYFQLGNEDDKVTFRTIWYEASGRRRTLRGAFRGRQNGNLHALFWLSKDLHEKGSFQDALLPDAKDLAKVRNHLEHKFLRLHDSLGIAVIEGHRTNLPRRKALGHSISYDAMQEKTLRLMKLARAALIYLSFSVSEEETSRQKDRTPGGLLMPIYSDTWDDDWKRVPC